MRSVEGIVEADDDSEKPSQNGEDFVGDDRVLRVLIALGEWIYCVRVLSKDN